MLIMCGLYFYYETAYWNRQVTKIWIFQIIKGFLFGFVILVLHLLNEKGAPRLKVPPFSSIKKSC